MPRPRTAPTDPVVVVADPTRVSAVLADVSYPARTWQLITHADYYGADAVTRAELHHLPVDTYQDLAAVIATVATQQRGQPSGQLTPR